MGEREIPVTSAKFAEVSLPAFERLLSEVIALSSISSPLPEWDQGNIKVIEKLADWFGDLGFKIEVQPVPDQPNKANLIATLGEGDKGLVLSGHTDTVPFDSSRWDSDPFKLIEKDRKLYGLGSCDMKGFFPIIIEALRGMEGGELKQPLIILATADEESSMAGARAIAKEGSLKARAAVIGEPTSIKPIRMHKGIMMESIRIAGRSGHSSNPALGNSALEGMQDMMSSLLEFRHHIQQMHRNQFFDIPYPTLNLGHIHGGDSPNRICAHCELSFDLRPLPGMNIDELRHDIVCLTEKVSKSRGIEVNLQSLIGGVEPFETSAQAELVKLSESLTNASAEAVAFATEAPFLSNMGIETIVMGAGSIDQAHQPNEFLALNEIKPMAKVLRALITHYCIDGALL